MNPVVETERFALRYIGPGEAPLVLNFLLDNVAHFQHSAPTFAENYLTEAYQILRLDHDRSNRENGQAFRFWICPKNDPTKLLGDVHFNQIIRGGFQSCFVGYKVGLAHCKQGVMTEALTAACKFMFESSGLHRIEANIMPRNSASRNVVEKIGFRNEGLAKDFLKINGTWEDHYRYALLNDKG